MIWIDVEDCMLRNTLGALKFFFIGSSENPSDSFPSVMELEGWAKTAWRLKGSLMVAF